METDKKLPDNVINFKANGSHPEKENIPEAIAVDRGEEMMIQASKDAQKLRVVGVTRRTFDERDYNSVLLASFDRALDDTKDEGYEHEIPLDTDRKVVDNVLEKIFSEDLSGDYPQKAKLLLRSETDKSIDAKELSEAAASFNELEYLIGRAKSSIIEKMTENYKKTRTSIRGRGAVATERVASDMKDIQGQIREIVELKTDEKVARYLGLKNLEEYDKVTAIAKTIQAQEAQEAYGSMVQ